MQVSPLSASAEAPQQPLPPLREDLRLHPAAANPDGSPAWTIQDPVGNVFYRIGWLEFELLSRWHLGTREALLVAMHAETALDPTEEEIEAVQQFLAQHHLLEIHAPQFTDQLLGQYRRAKLSRAKWLLHNYLFFRIPLWHPDRWLARAYPHVGWLYSRLTAFAVLAMALIGLGLTVRQWDMFSASFMESLSPAGLLGYLLALMVAKSLHELGHAFTATRYGVRVAHMGIAFLVLWPILYTDTGESWRLRDRRQRLAIASAGILTELALAGIATLAWNLAPPGDARQALFFLATTSWVLSLALNASPFMRFDGYFILSDLLDLPNLHERAFALARTQLRNTLWGWRDPWPEDFAPGRRRGLIAFAWATWIYRFLVFLGIAVLVYYYFFKLLGILLFLVEIGWFVLRPIWSELKVWHERRAEILPRRRYQVAAALGLLLLAGAIPWNPQIRADGWVHAERSHVFYSPLGAQLTELKAPVGAVPAGAEVFALAQPELRYKAELASLETHALERQLSGLLGIPEGESQRARLLHERAMRQAESHAEQAEQNRLILRAPFAGLLTDVDPELSPGVWVNPNQPLAWLVDPASWQVEAYVRQNDLERIAPGSPARFYPRNAALRPLSGVVESVDRTHVSTLPHPLLSAQHGGQIPVMPEGQNMTPRYPLFRVRVRLDRPPPQMRVAAGQVVLSGKARSWLGEAGTAALAVLVREATF